MHHGNNSVFFILCYRHSGFPIKKLHLYMVLFSVIFNKLVLIMRSLTDLQVSFYFSVNFTKLYLMIILLNIFLNSLIQSCLFFPLLRDLFTVNLFRKYSCSDESLVKLYISEKDLYRNVHVNQMLFDKVFYKTNFVMIVCLFKGILTLPRKYLLLICIWLHINVNYVFEILFFQQYLGRGEVVDLVVGLMCLAMVTCLLTVTE